MPKFSTVALAAAAVLLTATSAHAQTTHHAVAHARVRPEGLVPGVGHATVVPFSTISATIEITDTGNALSVSGHGTGFNTGLAYTSFFYGNKSVPTGSLACLPPTPNTLTALQMITAYWLPTTSTTRTLVVKKTGTSYVPLSQIATASVRYDSTPTLPLTTNLNPGRFWLNSCGAIL